MCYIVIVQIGILSTVDPQLHTEVWVRDFLIFLFTIKHFTSLFAHRKNP